MLGSCAAGGMPCQLISAMLHHAPSCHAMLTCTWSCCIHRSPCHGMLHPCMASMLSHAAHVMPCCTRAHAMPPHAAPCCTPPHAFTCCTPPHAFTCHAMPCWPRAGAKPRHALLAQCPCHATPCLATPHTHPCHAMSGLSCHVLSMSRHVGSRPVPCHAFTSACLVFAGGAAQAPGAPRSTDLQLPI